MKRIAVQCETEDEWDEVESKMFSLGKKWCNVHQNHIAYEYSWPIVFITDNSCMDQGKPGGYVKANNITIITAQEYLNEGGKDVSEFKVGDRVECINISKITRQHNKEKCKLGDTYTVTHLFNDGTLGLKELIYIASNSDFKLANKTQTTKENNMKENNIDSNVLATFGGKVKGDELVVIDRHFTPDMLQKILMETHHKAIQEACGEAEAKRLEKEAKDKE